MTRRLLILAIIGLVTGSILGFLGTWANHRDESGQYNYGEDYWIAILALPSLPGNIITWQQYGAYDWGIDEDWDYRIPITIWNGLFWSVSFVVTGGAWTWWKTPRASTPSTAGADIRN